jgi:hypothetical protein
VAPFGLGRSSFARPSHRKAESIPYDGQQIPRGLTAARDDNNRLSVVGFQKSNQHLFRDLSVLSGENDFEFQTADPSRPDGRS